MSLILARLLAKKDSDISESKNETVIDNLNIINNIKIEPNETIDTDDGSQKIEEVFIKTEIKDFDEENDSYESTRNDSAFNNIDFDNVAVKLESKNEEESVDLKIMDKVKIEPKELNDSEFIDNSLIDEIRMKPDIKNDTNRINKDTFKNKVKKKRAGKEIYVDLKLIDNGEMESKELNVTKFNNCLMDEIRMKPDIKNNTNRINKDTFKNKVKKKRAEKEIYVDLKLIDNGEMESKELNVTKFNSCLIDEIRMKPDIKNDTNRINKDTFKHKVKKKRAGKKMYACLLCEQKFDTSSSLDLHMVYHMGEKIYECNICNKKFGRLNYLDDHLLLHVGEKPRRKTKKKIPMSNVLTINYVCFICGKSFAQSNQLTIHLRTHSGERPYPCKVCKKLFSSSSSVSKHMVIHTRERRYECTVCCKRFVNSTTLHVHNRVHTGERPYECSICLKRFTQLCSCKKHMLNHARKAALLIAK